MNSGSENIFFCFCLFNVFNDVQCADSDSNDCYFAKHTYTGKRTSEKKTVHESITCKTLMITVSLSSVKCFLSNFLPFFSGSFIRETENENFAFCARSICIVKMKKKKYKFYMVNERPQAPRLC